MIQHILPRRDAPSTAASSRAAPPQAESTPRPARRASRRRGFPRIPARPQIIQEVNESALTRATRRCWSLLFLRRRREQHCSFPRWRAGRRILCFILFLFQTNPGSASLEPSFAQAPVQDADAQVHYQMHPAPGLVCSDRPEGCLHSCFDPSLTQIWFLWFAFKGRAW